MTEPLQESVEIDGVAITRLRRGLAMKVKSEPQFVENAKHEAKLRRGLPRLEL
jgi:hypothetical protein